MKNISDIVADIHNSGANNGLTKEQTAVVVKATFEAISNSLVKTEEVNIHRFGIFTINHRNARVGRNPATGESVDIAASNSVKFKPSTVLKGMVR